MRPADIELLSSLGQPSVHPTEDRVVVAIGHPDLASDANVSQVWEFSLDGGARRRLTRGRADRSPAYSPDGRAIAFLRPLDGSPQLHVVDARGGEPIVVTDRKLGVEEFVWSPDSRSIAFVSREPERGRYGTVDGIGPDAEPPRRITQRTWSANGVGWITDRRAQLFLVDVPGLDDEPTYAPAPRPEDDAAQRTPAPVIPPARPLTTVDGEMGHPFFSPDGTELWFIGALHETRDADLRTDLFRIELDAPGDPESMTRGAPPRDVVNAAFGPDGALWAIAAELGENALDFVGTDYALYRSTRGADLLRLTDPEPLSVGTGQGGLAFDEDGRALVIADDRGRSPLLAVGADGASERVSETDDVVLSVGAAHGSVVAATATSVSSGDLVRLAPDRRALTSLGDALGGADLVLPVEEEHPSADGYPVHGWVAIPPGTGPHPVLLMIHGGPFAQYGVQLFDETQVLASAGYAVVYCNPRGSAGYGQTHGRAIKERMGTVDLDDVLAFLDGAIAAHPELDGGRAGILGGSYGGYLTAWTIAHDQRFSAAVVERAFLDPETFIGTSDIGDFFVEEYNGRDADARLAQSPQAVVDRVRTPTLVVHSELDLRCPLPAATRYFHALKRNGVDTELLVFPGENHELSRSGRPRHRVQRFEAILDWFGRYLPVGD